MNRHELRKAATRKSNRFVDELADAKINCREKIGTAPPPDAPALPAADCPVLIGLDCIAAWLGISRGRCRGLVGDGAIPTFRLPGRCTTCALKSAIGAVMEEYSRRPGAAAKAPPRNRSA